MSSPAPRRLLGLSLSTLLCFVLASGMTLVAGTAAAADELVYGAPLISGATLVEPGRYVSRQSFDDTVKWYERKVGRSRSVRWQRVINTPGLVAIHIENLHRGEEWSGINIYKKGAEVRVFYLARANEK